MLRLSHEYIENLQLQVKILEKQVELEKYHQSPQGPRSYDDSQVLTGNPPRPALMVVKEENLRRRRQPTKISHVEITSATIGSEKGKQSVGQPGLRHKQQTDASLNIFRDLHSSQDVVDKWLRKIFEEHGHEDFVERHQEEVIKLFQLNDITGSDLRAITMEDLRNELCIPSLAMRKFLFKHIAAAQTRGGAVDLGASTRSEPSNAPVAGKHGDSQQAASHRRPVVDGESVQLSAGPHDLGDRKVTHGKVKEEKGTRFSPPPPPSSTAQRKEEGGAVGELFHLWGARGSNLFKKDDCVERQEFLEMLKTLGVLERLQQTRANNIYDDSIKANTLSNTAGLDWNGFRNAISLVADELQLKSEDIKSTWTTVSQRAAAEQ